MSLYNILKQFCDHYLHYSTYVFNKDKQNIDNILVDICFDTAEALFYILTGTDRRTLSQNDEIVKYLKDNQVIMVELDGNDESHSFIIVQDPKSGFVHIIQSLGGIYSAFIKSFDLDKFSEIWNDFLLAHNTKILCDYENLRNTFEISIYSSPLLPINDISFPKYDIDQYEQYRKMYELEFKPFKPHPQYKLYRKQDIRN